MKFYFKLCMVLLFVSSIAKSQDVLIKRNGDELRCKVFEISNDQIVYGTKNAIDSLPMDTIRVNKEEVFMIRYENGAKDVFEKKNEVVEEAPAPPPSPILSEKIEVEGRRFYYQNRRIGKSKVIRILHTEHNAAINSKVTQSVVCSVFSPILKFASIPVGVIGFIFLGVEANSNSSNTDLSNANTGKICVGTFILAQAGGYTLEYFQYRNLKEAIKLYNALH